DTAPGRAAVQMLALLGLFERNVLNVWPAEAAPPPGRGDGTSTPPNPTDPCSDPTLIYANIAYALDYAIYIWSVVLLMPPAQPYLAWGGIHLLGGCEQVRILENRIEGGAGHGITLGGLLAGETRALESEEGRGPVHVTVQS